MTDQLSLGLTGEWQPGALDPGVLFTGRYQTWRPGTGVPIRTTIGSPKFWRHGPMERIAGITPYGVFRNPDLETTEEQQAAYMARLDDRADQILTDLDKLAARHPGKNLVILCFDDVWAGVECHRRWFANWWETRFGTEVPELEPGQ
jgi:hypothetical protein